VGYLACEYHVPVAELQNVVLFNGIAYLNNADMTSRQTLDGMASLYGAKAGHLPSSLVQDNINAEWLPGPKVVFYDASKIGGDADVKQKKNSSSSTLPSYCKTVWNTSAYFLFPWEAANTYHSLNDNVLSIISSIVLQHVTSPTLPLSRYLNTSSDFGHRTLFLFKRIQGTDSSLNPSLLFQLFRLLFEDDVRPAQTLLSGGPHCIRRLTWGSALKLFYRDSLVKLRRVVYKVFRHVIRESKEFPQILPPLQSFSGNSSKSSFQSSSSSPQLSASSIPPPRVVIITRNTTMRDPDPWRKVSRKSEYALLRAFEAQGAQALICCDFKRTVNNITKLLQVFNQADICIGMHGAGLSNCILGPEKQVLVEFQTHHAFGFDSYMKIAHMGKGSYIFYDSRDTPKWRGDGAGAVLPESDIKQLVELSMKEYRKIRRGGEGGQGQIRSTSSSSSYSSITNTMNTTPQNMFETEEDRIMNSKKVQRRSFLVKSITTTSSSTSKTKAKTEQLSSSAKRRKLVVVKNVQQPVAAQAQKPATIFMPSQNDLNAKLKKFITFPSTFITKRTLPPPNSTHANSSATFSLENALSRDLLLGPLLKDNDAHCRQLPYYKLRLLCMPPKEHKFECDRNKIYRQATGAIDNKLLSDFIAQNGRAFYF